MKKLILSIGFVLSVLISFAQRESDLDVLLINDSIIMNSTKVTDMAPGEFGTDAVNLDQLSDSIQNNLFVQPLDSLSFNPDISTLPTTKYTIYADTTDNTLSVPIGTNGVVMQINQESLGLKHNATGAIIEDGSVCRGVGVVGGRVSIEKALSVDRHTALVVATQEIADGANGLCVELFGKVRGINTSGLSLGQVWLSSSTPGALTSTAPPFPEYAYPIGAVTVVDAVNGVIDTRLDGVDFNNTIRNAWNGAIRETLSATIASDGATVTLSLERDGGGDLTMMYSTGFEDLDCTPAITVTLTPGTDTNPQINFVYIPLSTKVLTVSASSWPTEEHIKICTAVLQSAATTQTNEALRNQNWNDHLAGSTGLQGHILHITEWIRQNAAIWNSGALGTLTIRAASGTPDTLTVSNTGGKDYQLHKHTFPAMDMYTGDDIHMVNDFTTPYKTVSDLSGELTDASGNSLAGRYYSITVWGAGNKSGEQSHLMANLPINSYNSSAAAIADADNFSVYTIPMDFTGVGFLIARFTLQHSAASGGTWTLHSTEDLRGQFPSTAAGGGSGGGGGVTEFLGLTDTYNDYAGLAGYFNMVNSGETAVEAVDPATLDVSIFNDNGTYMDNATHNAAALTGQYVDEASAQTLINKTITEPTIADFTNSPHDHSDATNGGTVDYPDLTNKPAITDLELGNTWKVYYSDGTGLITELALGGTDTYLRSGGIATAPNWGTPAGTTPTLDEVTTVDSVSTHKIAAPVFIATVADGTKPFEVTSTTLNNNLNADLLDGSELADIDFQLVTDNDPSTTNSVMIGLSSAPASQFDVYGADVTASPFFGTIRIADTKAQATTVGGSIELRGKYTDGGEFAEAALVKAYKDNSTSGNFGFGLGFSTRPNGGNMAEHMRIASDGNISMTDGLTVADAPAVSTDVVRLTDVEDASIDGDFNTLQVNGTNVLTSVAVRENWLGANYTYESLTSTPPTTGEIRFNTSNPASATNMYVFQTDEDGFDRAAELGALASGDWVSVSNTSGNYFRYILSGTPTDNGTWWTVPVTFKNGVASLTDEEDIALDFLYLSSGLWSSHANGIAPSDISDNILIGSTSGTGGGTWELDVSGRMIITEEIASSSWIKGDYFIAEEQSTTGTPGGTTGHYWMNSTADRPFFTNSAEVYDLTNASGFEVSSDPSIITGGYVLWQSDGTGAGDDGDIMIKINDGSTTKTITLVDFSAF